MLTMVSAIIGRRGATRAFCSAGREFKRLSALSSERLRVVSYNIHAFRDSDHEDNFDRIVDFLSPLDADVICLQECLNQYAGGPPDYFSTVRRGEGRGVPLHFAGDETYLERLASSLAMPSHNFVQAERDLCYFGSIPFGCALLTRLDVVDWSSTVMKSSEDDSLLGDQERDFAESRAALWATLRFQGSDVVVATTHLDHKAEELRLKQIKSCLEAVSRGAKNEGEDKPLLICGVSDLSC